MKNENVNVTKLEDGLTVVTQNADFNKVFIGAWIKTGLINESDEENGLSHFLEHMVFKGTQTRSALQLSDYIEKLGGECNAYTSIEETVVHTSLLQDYWKYGVDFLADVIQNSVFPEEELERERAVIMQEIAMYENDPTSEMFRFYMENAYKGDPISRSILGPQENISSFTQDDLRNYFNKWYTPENIVISACGNINHDEFVDYVRASFKKGFRETKLYTQKENSFKNIKAKKQNIFSQSQFIIGTKGITMMDSDKDKMTYTILANILDGGMSCRLFQEIREKQGLAYQVSLITHTMVENGFIGVHASLEEKNIDKAIQLSKNVLSSVKENISDDELMKAKNSVTYGLSSKHDSCSSLATSNGIRALFGLDFKTFEEIKELIYSITKDDVYSIANKYIPNEDSDDYCITIMTPWDKTNEERN